MLPERASDKKLLKCSQKYCFTDGHVQDLTEKVQEMKKNLQKWYS